ncbi:MAG: amino acid permease [Betaproteobacteria bacterium]|nr:amino acid permease [Betaproteobacteria bacterium]
METKPMTQQEPKNLLTPIGAIALIVGIVIGAGIFKTPSMVAGVTGDVGWVIVVWVVGALVSLMGALCYAELCTAYPHAGGDYHFLYRAFGRHISFLYAWSRATVINPGSIALLAFVFGDYFGQVWSLGTYSNAIWAYTIVILLTAINVLGVNASARLQMFLTVFEVLGLVAVIVAGFVVPTHPTADSTPFFSSTPPLAMLGLALVFVLLTFGGWNESAYVSAELKGTSSTMVRVIVISMLTLTAIYLLVNIALINGLGLKGLADSKTAASDLIGLAFGPWAQKALGVFVAIATLTSINATMVVGARSSFAIGRDWKTLRALGHWQGERGSPTHAYLFQTLISLALITLGTQESDGFSAMVEFTAPVFWGFLCLVGASLFWLRIRDPQRAKPFKVPLYPLTPALFCLACAYLTYSSIGYAMSQNAIHVSVLLLFSGSVVLAFIHWREK